MRTGSNNEFNFSAFWRYITNLWTVVFIGVIISDFLTFGKYHYLLAPFSVIYGAVLSIFVGTKEFDRWYDSHKGRKHPGEVFVIIWSLLLLVMGSISWIYGKLYAISTDVISVYIMVLTVFAITQSSKRIYKNKRRN
jgi:hypothetical protein